MNTEDRIPAPQIVYPNKAALKRKPVIRTWISTAAAAIVVCSLGLGYFFSQWSAPPQESITLARVDSIIPETQKANEPLQEPDAICVKSQEQSVAAHKPVQTEQIADYEQKNEDTEELVQVERVRAYAPVVTNSDIDHVAVIVATTPRVSLPMVVHSEEILTDEEPEPEKRRAFLGGVFDSLKPSGDLREYGKEIKEILQNIPQRLAIMKEESNKPFRKTIKEEEI